MRYIVWRALSLVLCVLLAAGLFGCTGKTPDSSSDGGTSTSGTQATDTGTTASAAAASFAETATLSAEKSTSSIKTSASSARAANSSTGNTDLLNSSHVRLNESNAKWHGRTYEKNGYTMFNWTASGFEIRFIGTGVECLLTVIGGTSPYLNIFIDGREEPADVAKIRASSGWVTLASGLPDGEHTVRVAKLTECIASQVGVLEARLLGGGRLLSPPAQRTRRIEFIGDSITCGHGNIRPDGEADSSFNADKQDGWQSYAGYTARALNADFNVFAISGARVTSNEDTLRHLPSGFAYTDHIHNAGAAWDFSRFAPDVVVVALGTNDYSRFIRSGGLSAIKTFKEEYTAFLRVLRERYPKAHIICSIGTMTMPCYQYVHELVSALGDSRVYAMYEPPAASGHPVVSEHKAIAEKLTAQIKQVTGW